MNKSIEKINIRVIDKITATKLNTKTSKTIQANDNNKSINRWRDSRNC